MQNGFLYFIKILNENSIVINNFTFPMSCSRFTGITHSSDHRKAYTVKLFAYEVVT